MAPALTFLDAKVSGKFYTYIVAATDSNIATTTTRTLEADLKGYSAYVQQNGDTFRQTICESVNTVATSANPSIGAPTAFETCADATTQKVID
jgi:hypothetical protein